jgi:type IV pilus assembly protein PilW
VPLQVPVAISGYAAADVTPACIPHRKEDTAILVLRRVNPVPTPVASANVGGYLQVSKCLLDPKTFVVSESSADFTLHNLDCVTVADVHALLVRMYYVATCNVCGTDTIPTLKRAEVVGEQIVITPIAEGVENLQVEYGFDANNDGRPDKFLANPDATLGVAYGLWNNVMAARLYALFRSTDTQPGYVDATKTFNLGPAGYTAPANDGYRRILLTSLAVPKNPAGQRETP